MSDSAFLLTAGVWKIGSVSKSSFLLTVSFRSNGKKETTWMYRREAGGFEGRAAHGSVVGAEIRGWRSRELVGAGERRK